MIRYEILSSENFNHNSLDTYERTQPVTKVYRKINGVYIPVDCCYTEDWDIDKKRCVASDLMSDDFITYLALDVNTVVGFIGLHRNLRDGYMILDLMQVSAEFRRRGIGRKLFEFGKQEAKHSGAAALYISACSSVETIEFYKAMGASIAEQPIREIAESEPYDLQMICKV